MLKALTYKHKEILRRLVVGQDIKIIEQELSVSAATINRLKKHDPLFMSELSALQQAANSSIVDSMERLSVMEMLENAAYDAVDFCQNVINGKIDDTPPDLRLKSAFDVLDRTGHKPTEKKVVGVMNAADMIIAAYNAKKGKSEEAAIEA